MNAKTIIAFVLGAAAGVAASWHLAQKKWEKYGDEDIKSVKDAYAKKIDSERAIFKLYRHQVIKYYGEEADKTVMDSVTLISDARTQSELNLYSQKVTDLGYTVNQQQTNISYNKSATDTAKSTPPTNYNDIQDVSDRKLNDLPYIIRDELYGTEDYEQIALVYNINMAANERELFEEISQKPEDELKLLGEDVIDYIDNQAEFESDDGVQEICVVHVRDDILKVDYEITCNRW